MTTPIQIYYIIGCSTSALIVAILLIRHFNLNNEVKKIIPKNFKIKHKVDPFVYQTEEEFKDEFEIRKPQISGEENV